VAVFDPETLAPVERLDAPARLAVAVWFGDVRLIDNCALG
jgi:pantoate--beta-alanine ligase